MDFEKRIKTRMYLGLLYIVIGAAMFCFYVAKNDAVLSNAYCGTVFLVIGVCFFIKNLRILKDEKRMHRLEIYETDERNVQITHAARSLTATLYSTLLAVMVLVCYALGKKAQADFAGAMLIAFVAIYLVCLGVMKKKY